MPSARRKESGPKKPVTSLNILYPFEGPLRHGVPTPRDLGVGPIYSADTTICVIREYQIRGNMFYLSDRYLFSSHFILKNIKNIQKFNIVVWNLAAGKPEQCEEKEGEEDRSLEKMANEGLHDL
jgi:hypothetical protein